MSWLGTASGSRLKLPSVREHQRRGAQELELNRVVLRQFVAKGRDDGRREPVVIEGHFVFIRRHVTVHQAARDFGKQLRHPQQIVELTPGVHIHRGLAKGVAEHADTAQTVARQLLIDGDQDHLFVIWVLAPVVGVR